jgi:dihydrofolate reductase
VTESYVERAPRSELAGTVRTVWIHVVSCATEARAAAGDRAVMVHGAGAAQALLHAGQLDELEIHLVPVLLNAGRRLFETRDSNHIELQLIRRLESRDATHLRYRVRHHT